MLERWSYGAYSRYIKVDEFFRNCWRLKPEPWGRDPQIQEPEEEKKGSTVAHKARK